MKINRRIYQFWTDDNIMSENRKNALKSLGSCTSVPTEFLEKSAIEERLLKEHPLHPGYKFLTSIQKGDYLKFYFMHHFGGGYADIKYYSPRNNWSECFDYMDEHEEVEVVGMHEIPGGSPIKEYNTTENLEIVLSNGFFIFRPHSMISTMCYEKLLSVMDSKYDELEKHPAKDAYNGGDGYPMSWHSIMGEIFHPVLVEIHKTNPEKISNMLNPGWVMNMWHR